MANVMLSPAYEMQPDQVFRIEDPSQPSSTSSAQGSTFRATVQRQQQSLPSKAVRSSLKRNKSGAFKSAYGVKPEWISTAKLDAHSKYHAYREKRSEVVARFDPNKENARATDNLASRVSSIVSDQRRQNLNLLHKLKEASPDGITDPPATGKQVRFDEYGRVDVQSA